MPTAHIKKLATVVRTELPVLVRQRQRDPWDSLSPQPTLNRGLWASEDPISINNYDDGRVCPLTSTCACTRMDVHK